MADTRDEQAKEPAKGTKLMLCGLKIDAGVS
jgi:hypothetical protein